MTTELFGLSTCPYTSEMRDWLEADARSFIEHDVEQDPVACQRLLRLTGGRRTVPVLVESGRVVRVGWLGRGCVISLGSAPDLRFGPRP